MSALSFRPAESGDVPSVVALVNSAYRGEGSKRGWTTEADLLGGLRIDDARALEMISRQDSRVELAFDEARTLVGCVSLKRESSGACYLAMLTVDPTRQAEGFGKRIMDRSEAIACEWGCSRMRISVIHLRSELLAYYERRGYRRTGRSEPFAGDPRAVGDLKVQGLTLIELVKPLDA